MGRKREERNVRTTTVDKDEDQRKLYKRMRGQNADGQMSKAAR